MSEPQDSAPDEPAAPNAPEAAETAAAPDAPPSASAARTAADAPAADEAAEVAPPAPADNAADVASAPPAAEPPMSPAACGARLAELFPALFVAPGSPGSAAAVKPIKLRIHADIQARAPGVFSRRVLGPFFARYTTTNAYLKALTAEGAQRFDLDGQPAGEIAEEHRAAAIEELARRREIHQARLAVERQAHKRPRPPTPPVARPGDAHAATAEPGGAPQGSPRPRPGRFDKKKSPAQRPQRAPQAQAPRDDDARRSEFAAPPPPSVPDDPARRERAQLLHAFESSPLNKHNFCVLKRIDEATLDAALAQARQERAERSATPQPRG